MNASTGHDRRTTAMPDSAWIGNIAREVIRRLQSEAAVAVPSAVPSAAPSAPAVKLVTLETLQRTADAGEIHLAASCVVTPAAKEEASRRGIKLVRPSADTAKPTGNRSTPTGPDADSGRDALAVQMARRNITLRGDTEIVWSETPAAEVCRRCAAGRRAVMITAYSDVERFAAEVSPQAWVLDAERLSLVAATNVAARIARLSHHEHGGDR